MTIVIDGAHRIVRDDKPVRFVQAKNHGGVITPTAIVLHDTASGLKPDGDIDWLSRGSPNSSAHVVIARDGAITQLVPVNIKAWHAGVSKWGGRSNCNDFTVGIEIDNPGRLAKVGVGGSIYSGVCKIDTAADRSLVVGYAKTAAHGEGHWLMYSDPQLASVEALCRALVAKYPTIREIVTHWLISPGRKVDTNPLFPLEQLRDRVFGNRDPEPQMPASQPAPDIVPDASVTATGLNLRGAPGGSVIALLPRGTRLDVQESDSVNGWLRVIVADGASKGKTGFVSKSFVQLD